MAAVGGCLGSDELRNDGTSGFDAYGVAVTESKGDGDLTLTGEAVHDATEEHPGVVRLTVENQAREKRRYYPTHNVGVPSTNRSFEHQTDDEFLRLRRIDGHDPAADEGFERHGACWHHNEPIPDDAGAMAYEPGEVSEYYLGCGQWD